jgi:chitodextrinase
MPYTPAAGKWLVVFTGECTSDSANSIVSFKIYKGGTAIEHSGREQQVKSANQYNSVGTSALLTASGSEQIDVRLKADGSSTATFKNRAILFIRQA